MTQPSPRLPAEPLIALSGLSLRAFAAAVGLGDAQINRDRRRGGFTPLMADRLAVFFGHTPGEVWGDAWWNLPDGCCGEAFPGEHLLRKRDRDRHRSAARRSAEATA